MQQAAQNLFINCQIIYEMKKNALHYARQNEHTFLGVDSLKKYPYF